MSGRCLEQTQALLFLKKISWFALLMALSGFLFRKSSASKCFSVVPVYLARTLSKTLSGKNTQTQMSCMSARNVLVHTCIGSPVCPSVCLNDTSKKGHHIAFSGRQIHISDSFLTRVYRTKMYHMYKLLEISRNF